MLRSVYGPVVLPANWAAVFQPRKPAEDHPHAPLRDKASIGPRSFNRGNGGSIYQRPLGAVASIGPRSFNRGNIAVARPIMPVISLQLGRGLSTAETAVSYTHLRAHETRHD